MKLYRGLRDSITYSKKPAEYLDSLYSPWTPGKGVRIRVAVSISAVERIPDVYLLIEEADVIALFMTFLKADPQRLFELLSNDLKARDEEIEKLRKANSTMRGKLLGLRRRVPAERQQEIDRILSREGEDE